MTTNAKKSLTESFLEKINKQYRPRNCLYHYTSFEVLQKIIKNKNIHLTNIRYMNDIKEFYSAHEFLKKRIDRLIDEMIRLVKESNSDQYGEQKLDTFKSVLLEKFNPDSLLKKYSIFTFCLSENADLLSQWRGYCPNYGLSIGFNGSSFSIFDHSFLKFNLIKCMYTKKHMALITKYIDEIYRIWKNQRKTHNVTIYSGPDGERYDDYEIHLENAAEIEIIICFLYASVKDQAFYEEHE
ncbi:hypothetical protein GF406_04690 [candidate division KSB1 bacterium]|nr:hypothetical protein [candidate division KSB1 bacterium]